MDSSTFLRASVPQVSNTPDEMSAFRDDFATQFSSCIGSPDCELEDLSPHECQLATSVFNTAQTYPLCIIPSPGNPCFTVMTLDEVEMRSGFDQVPAPEIDTDVMTEKDIVRGRQLEEDVTRLSLTEVEPPKVSRGREQSKQIVFSLFNTRRYNICLIVRTC